METCKRISSEYISVPCYVCEYPDISLKPIQGFAHCVETSDGVRFYCADHCPVHKDVNQLTAVLKEASE